jgi:DNA helicase-2/ATP-dependent DNA helicase PcrA
MPHRIVISDEDIDRAADAMRCQFHDTARREALRCTDCRDIQACPGSGKTTLVVAKLMILAEHWRWNDRGVCVLSHTNVAREEVEKRLAQHPKGHRLLHYPHFIGTIQKFVDQFLALPYMRSHGMEIHVVDNDRFAAEATRRFGWRRFQTAQVFLRPSQHEGRDIVSGLRWEGENLSLGSAGGAIRAGSQTPSYQQLLQLKQSLCDDGYFRFDDMFAYAMAYVRDAPQVVVGLRLRFPWVFVDEMQDTDTTQDVLLRKLFGDQRILQRFGDVNQAIYGSNDVAGTQTAFPTTEVLELSDSMRFGPPIADFASTLTCVRSQSVTGNPDLPSRRHTVFLFDESTIEDVIPAFARLLEREFSEGLPRDFTAKAVGFRKSAADGHVADRFPYALGEYWPPFRPEFTVSAPRPKTLLGYVSAARRCVAEQGDCHDGHGMVVQGVLDLLHIQGARDGSDRRFNPSSLADALEAQADGRLAAFQEVKADLLLAPHVMQPERWAATVDNLRRVLEPWMGTAIAGDAEAFLVWAEHVPDPAEHGGGRSAQGVNVYRHEGAVDGIEIEVTTIHAAKGQTHTATLVLETYWHQFDLAETVPYLVGARTLPRPATGRRGERIKRVYVAMTRPRELLCLALHRNHVSSEQARALEDRGWCVEYLGG